MQLEGSSVVGVLGIALLIKILPFSSFLYLGMNIVEKILKFEAIFSDVRFYWLKYIF